MRLWNINRYWIKTKYFKEDYIQRHKDKYILTSPNNPKIQLIKMSWIHINYARMIKYNCNPYDPEYTGYIKKQLKEHHLNIFTVKTNN